MTPIELTEDKKNILELGLSYAPHTNFDYATTRLDVYKAVRKLKLRKFHLLKSNKTVNLNSEGNQTALTQSDVPMLNERLELWETEGVRYNNINRQEVGSVTGVQAMKQIPSTTPSKPPSTFNPRMPRDSLNVFHKNVTSQLNKLQKETLNKKWRYNKQSQQY